MRSAMLMDVSHALIRSLVTEWEGDKDLSEEQRSRRSKALQAQLAQGISHSLQSYQGQLVLLYHEFLTMEPTGEHSFGYGSSMWSKTVYWVTVAKLAKDISLIRREFPGRTLEIGAAGEDLRTIRIGGSVTFLVPVQWQWSLYPYYPGGRNQPAFGFILPGRTFPWTAEREPDAVSRPTTDPLNISSLGEHFFGLHEGKHDWATKIFLVLGTDAVKQWLDECASSSIYAKLQELELN